MDNLLALDGTHSANIYYVNGVFSFEIVVNKLTTIQPLYDWCIEHRIAIHTRSTFFESYYYGSIRDLDTVVLFKLRWF